jgi:hypothetical protein
VVQFKSFEPDMKYNLDGITLYVQLVSTSCLVQNFWMESPCMFKFSVLHFWFKTFGWKHHVCWTCLQLNIQGGSIQNFVPDIKYWQVEHTGWFNTKVWTRHEVLTSWTYRVIHSKSFEPDMIFLYVQFVSTSCLVQYLDGITLYVQLVRFKTFGWNLLVCSICQYFMTSWT